MNNLNLTRELERAERMLKAQVSGDANYLVQETRFTLGAIPRQSLHETSRLMFEHNSLN